MAASNPSELGHVRRDYGTEEIVVHWDSSRCIHSANCLTELPEVFDVRRRPWIRPAAASADQLAAAIDSCPSRALTYTRADGHRPGPNGVGPPDAPEAGRDLDDPSETVTEVVISLKPDGPLSVEGPVRIELARGEVVHVADRAVLCRCGGSERKPFCDGSHKRNGFHATGW